MSCSRRSILSLSILLLASLSMPGTTAAQQADPSRQRLEKSGRHHERVSIEASGGRTVSAFVVFPEVDRPVPAVVVIHENRGLTDWVRSVADQLAEAGYVAIAPDFLSQTGPGGGDTESFESSDAARDGIYRLPPEQVLSDLDATVKYVRDLEATSDKVTVAGFCWGGGQAFRYATHNPDIAAAFVFYGTAPEGDALAQIEAPVYGFYGGNDFRITGQVPKVEEQLKRLNKKYEPVVYKEAGHGFMRSGEEPEAKEPDRDAREAAWERWKDLLAKLE